MSDQRRVTIYSVDESVARITLNRPEKRNALNAEMIDELKQALIEADKNESVRVVLINGAGPDFCSGADLALIKKISEASVAENVDDAHSLLELFVLMRNLSVPVIAAVHGRALAGGCGLASACDLILTSSSARFGYPEVKIGFVPAMVLAIIRRNLSEKKAFELLTLGREFGADEAKLFGLVNEVFDDKDFAAASLSFAKKFKGTSRSAVSLTKNLLYKIDGLSFLEALQLGADTNVIARLTEDCQKGIAEFLSRR